MKKYFSLIAVSMLVSHTLQAQYEDKLHVKLNGFGDIVYGELFGGNANQQSADLFKKYGDDQFPTGMHNGLNMHGFDLTGSVTMKKNFKFLTELNLEGFRGADGGAMEMEIERMNLDYNISDKLGFRAGLIYTPIGYINRNLYSRAWLMNSIRFYQAVETSAGNIPNHFLGFSAYGTFKLTDNSGLNYELGCGKSRGKTPTEENFNNEDPGYQTAGLLEWQWQGESDLRIAVSGFSNRIHTFNIPDYGQEVNIEDSSAQPLLLQEIGFNPYISYKGKLFDLLAEYDYVEMHILKTPYDYPTITKLNALSAEIAVNTRINKKRIAPYVRYEFVFLPANDGPFYGLREKSEGVLYKSYSPDMNAIMTGVAFDFTANIRLKTEYIHHFDGAFQSNGIFVQTAFGF